MKLKSLDFPTGYFYFDNAAINSDKVEVIAVGYRNTDKTIKIWGLGSKIIKKPDKLLI
ncbi:hypothetical protein I7Q09_10380 [Neisseria meningitidis]|nr:hypothetical protein [Neisseria meningitidis]